MSSRALTRRLKIKINRKKYQNSDLDDRPEKSLNLEKPEITAFKNPIEAKVFFFILLYYFTLPRVATVITDIS